MVKVLEERYLSALLRRSGMTAQQLADASGVDESTISRIRSGNVQNPRPDTWEAIVVAAGGSLEEWQMYVECRLTKPAKEANEQVGSYAELQAQFNALLDRQTIHYEREMDEFRQLMNQRDECGARALRQARKERNIFLASTVLLLTIMACMTVADALTRHLGWIS